MKRLTAVLTTMLFAVALLAGPAAADQHDHDVPEHPHAMLIDFELIDDGGTPLDPFDDVVDFHRCIDLAANQSLPLQAHHHHIHTGTAGAGDPSVGLTAAGHFVMPLQPYGPFPFEDCADIEALAAS